MTRRVFLAVTIGFLTIAFLAAGCASHRLPEGYATTDPNMPVTITGLLDTSHRTYQKYGPVDSVRDSLVAANRVLPRVPGSELANYFSARASLWLIEFDPALDKDSAKILAAEGMVYIERAIAARGACAEYEFLAGALQGYTLKGRKTPPLIQMRQVKEHFEKAIDLDPEFDGGAPLRALGSILFKAPAWPVGVGDLDTALDFLQAAAEQHPTHPANHAFYAEALVEDGQEDKAREHYRRALEICEDPRWGAVCAKYTAMAKAGLEELDDDSTNGLEPFGDSME